MKIITYVCDLCRNALTHTLPNMQWEEPDSKYQTVAYVDVCIDCQVKMIPRNDRPAYQPTKEEQANVSHLRRCYERPPED